MDFPIVRVFKRLLDGCPQPGGQAGVGDSIESVERVADVMVDPAGEEAEVCPLCGGDGRLVEDGEVAQAEAASPTHSSAAPTRTYMHAPFAESTVASVD
jgi:hypothetical protein